MYYLFSLLDSQAGWVIGLLMLMGVFYAIKHEKNKMFCCCLQRCPGVLFFTLVAKKQVYYISDARSTGSVGWSTAQVVMDWNGLWGLVVVAKRSGGDSREDSCTTDYSCKYVEPSYVWLDLLLAQSYRVSDVLAQMVHQPQEVIVFSEDQGGTKVLWCCNFRNNLMGMYEVLLLTPSGFGSFQNKMNTSFGFVPHRYSLIFPIWFDDR